MPVDYVVVALVVSFEIGGLVGTAFGTAQGVAAGVTAAAAGFLDVFLCYDWTMSKFQRRYSSVYRVLSVPQEPVCVKADNVEIEQGDYGWQAEPIFKDGRIYLQGLTVGWCVAWYAGFEPDQIERVCQKPRSQYYLPYDWAYPGATPPPCPYPVLHSAVNHLGLPEPVYFPCVQWIRVKPPRFADRASWFFRRIRGWFRQ